MWELSQFYLLNYWNFIFNPISTFSGWLLKTGQNDWHQKSHLRIATKYPNIANNYFANLGIQTEIIKLNGAIEIAPKLQLCDYILDLVSSGKTLQENNMIEIKKIFDVSSYLVVNRNSLKTNSQFINQIINIFDV